MFIVLLSLSRISIIVIFFIMITMDNRIWFSLKSGDEPIKMRVLEATQRATRIQNKLVD